MTPQAASATRHTSTSSETTAPAAPPAAVPAERRSTTREDGYIHVVNWEKFQHYQTGRNHKQNDMKWIRTYTELLDKDEYLELPATDRALLHAIWMATGKLGNCRCSASVRSMKRRFKLRYVTLDRLIHAGFIDVHPRSCPRPEQSRAEEEEENLQFELPQDPKVDDANGSSQLDGTQETVDLFGYHADRLLAACDAPHIGSERLKLLQLWAGGAGPGAFESARERVLTKQGPIRNKFGLAVTVIRAEALERVSA